LTAGETPIPSTVVFIGGYGRSGSTLLDMFLASRLSGVFGAGELVNLFEELTDGGRCACGAPVAQCEVWGKVAAVAAEQGLSAARAQAITVEGYRPLGHAGSAYFGLWRGLLGRLRQVTGSEVLIDSSKVTRTRLRYGARLHEMGVRMVVLHLVRDPDDVVASARLGSNRAIERGLPTGGSLHVLRGIFGWLIGNLGTQAFARRIGAPRRLVRYELLVQSEDYRRELLEWVAAQAGVTANGTSGAVIARGHGLSGNRVRRAGSGPVELRWSPVRRSAHPVDRMAGTLLRRIGEALGYYEPVGR
jgi:hypothetical protein